MTLSRGPRENGFRPAIDPLLRSAAYAYGPRAMGVILSGALDDGTYGLKVLKEAGGVAVAQDPNEAAQRSMPLSAIRFAGVDHVLRAEEIAALITELAGAPAEGAHGMARTREPEPQKASDETDIQEMQEELGPPSGLTCPDCGGALWEVREGQLMRYRCHVGHQFSVETLDAEQQDAVEAALWSAVRILEEHADLRERMARRAEASSLNTVAQGFTEGARNSRQQAHTIRELLYRREEPPHPPDTSAPSRKTKGGRKARRHRR
jgi:two-component system chemotaxis response regulator CheB